MTISESPECAKTLGLSWDTKLDCFSLTVSTSPSSNCLTKRMLVSDIAKMFDVLGWLAPVIIKVKILLQRIWEIKLDWDEQVPTSILSVWTRWKAEIPLLSDLSIPRYYFPKDSRIHSLQLHGFSDASEDAYAAVVYLHSIDQDDGIHVSLVIAKSRVSPIKRISIPRLELCGALLLSQLLNHLKEVFNLPLANIYAWTDSSIVLSWLSGSPRRFKTYVGNRVSSIVDRIPPDRWRHVRGIDNPADIPSRGVFPSDLLPLDLWWNGPFWLVQKETQWPTPC